MTPRLKELLRQYGMLAASLTQLHFERPGNPEAFQKALQAMLERLGSPRQGNADRIVRISADGGWRAIESTENEPEVIEVPEDEFYFLEAFRPALSDLAKQLPPFLFRMAFVYAYTLFEEYLTEVIRCRLTKHPLALGSDRQISYREVVDSVSREELIATLVEKQVYLLMHEPISVVLSKLRSRLGFESLPNAADDTAYRYSLMRNCIIHNASKVSPKLHAADGSLVIGDELHIDFMDIVAALIIYKSFAGALDRGLETL